MKIFCVTHADFETPGTIEHWAKRKNYDFKVCRPYQSDDCLVEEEFDCLIVMGGPQSSSNWDAYPYLIDEIKLIQRAIQNQKKIVGFCLGAQLIGEALGAQAQHSPEKEVGVFPISLTDESKDDPIFLHFPKTFPVIHWHNDMPGLTQDSVILAKSEGCPRQIVRYADNIYGFQCHLEIDRQGISEMIKACPGDLEVSRFTQSAEDLMLQDYATINELMIKFLEKFMLN